MANIDTGLIGQRICEALGLDPNLTSEIQISVTSANGVEVAVRMSPLGGSKITEALSNHKLVLLPPGQLSDAVSHYKLVAEESD